MYPQIFLHLLVHVRNRMYEFMSASVDIGAILIHVDEIFLAHSAISSALT